MIQAQPRIDLVRMWAIVSTYRVFPRPFTHGGDMGGQVQGDKALMGGTHEGGLMRGGLMRGGHRPYGGGDLTLIDYIIN